jgi:hypothetical protein
MGMCLKTAKAAKHETGQLNTLRGLLPSDVRLTRELKSMHHDQMADFLPTGARLWPATERNHGLITV